MPAVTSPVAIKKTPTIENLEQLLSESLNSPANKKGWSFERFFEALMSKDKNFMLVFKHSRTELGEIDYVYRHTVEDHPFWRLHDYVCIECKNWESNISSKEIAHLLELIREKRPFVCCGIFVSSGKYDPSAKRAISNARLKDEIIIIPIEKKHLELLIELGFKAVIQKLSEQTIFKKIQTTHDL